MKTVRIYMFSDSGPYGYWSKCPEEWKTEAYSGFGSTPIRNIPQELWERYEEADRLRIEAEAAIDDYVEKHSNG